MRLVEESEQGAPVVGTTVELDGRPFSDTRTKLKATSDDDGLVTFGLIHPGQYTLYFTTESGLRLGQSIVLYPAQEHEETVVYPTTTTPHADVVFSFDLPPDLEEEPFLLRCKVQITRPSVEVSGRWWWNHSKMMHYVLLTSNGEVLSDTSDDPGRSMIEMPELPDQPDARLRWMAGYARLEWIEGLIRSGKAGDGASSMFRSYGKRSFSSADTPKMRIQPDVLNTWSISLPDVLLKRLRKWKAAASQPAATQPSTRTGKQ